MTRIFALAGVVVAGLIVGGLTLGWLLLPALSEAGIKEAVARDTGRAITFVGRPRLSVWPELAVELRGVELSNPPEMFRGRFVAAETVRLKVRAWSLWRRTPEITEVLVLRPQINLVVDSEGRSNFAFERDGDGDEDAQSPPVVIVDGDLKYLNERSATTFAASHVDVILSRSGLAGPVELDGAFNWNDQRLSLAFYARSSARLTGQGSPADFTLTGPYLSAAFSGRAALKEGLELAGTFEFKAEPLADLLARAGYATDRADAFPALSASGALDLSPGAIAITQARFAFGTMNAEGDVALGLAGPKPQVTATLGLDRLDLETVAGGLLGSGAQDHEGWSEAPVDLAILNIVDAELSLAVAELAYGKLVAGASRLDVGIAEGTLEATLVDSDLYGGSASGRLSLDGTGPLAAFEATVKASGLDGGKLSAGLAAPGRVRGQADVELDLAARGASPQELIARLAGQARLRLRDGALVNLDVAALLGHVATEISDGWMAAEGGDTSFARLEARFAVADGIAETQDLALHGPVAEIAATGSIDLLSQRLDLKVHPEVVAGAKRRNAPEAAMKLPVPVMIVGSWSAPKIYPDVHGILEDPEQAYETLRKRMQMDAAKLDLLNRKTEKDPDEAAETP